MDCLSTAEPLSLLEGNSEGDGVGGLPPGFDMCRAEEGPGRSVGVLAVHIETIGRSEGHSRTPVLTELLGLHSPMDVTPDRRTVVGISLDNAAVFIANNQVAGNFQMAGEKVCGTPCCHFVGDVEQLLDILDIEIVVVTGS